MVTKPIPRTLFHGTATSAVPSIREHGLRVGTIGTHPGFEQDVQGCVFVAETEKDARLFGIAAVMDRDEKEIDFTVLLIDRLKAEMADIVFFEPQGKLDPESFKGRQFVACKDIPPEAVVGYIRVYMDPKTGRVRSDRGYFDRSPPQKGGRRPWTVRGADVHVRGHRRTFK